MSETSMNNLVGRTFVSALLGYVLFWVVLIVFKLTLGISVTNPLYMHQFIPWVVCSVVMWFLLRNFKMPFQPAAPTGDFKPSFKRHNIALDIENDQLWIAPTVGKPMVLHRVDILGWDHKWVDAHNAYGMLFHTKNEIRFRLNNLERPTASVKFGRDHQQAQDWHARLTKWINH